MRKSSLIQILSSLDDGDFKKFGKFIGSSYFNTNSKLIELYDILKNYYPGFDVLEFSKENLFSKLYGNKKYVEGTMKYLLSEMESLAESFIGIQKKNEIMEDLNILKEFKNKGLYSLFDKKFNLLKKKLRTFHDENNLYNYLLSNIYVSYLDKQQVQLTKKDLFRKEWLKPVDELLKFFLKAVLENILFLSNYKRIVNEKIDIPLLKEIILFLEREKKYFNDEELNLSFLQIKMLLNDDAKSYLELKEILNRKNKHFSRNQITGIINNLQIYCTSRLLKGDDIRREEFEIAKLRMKHELFLSENRIGIDVFYKFFMLAIAVLEFDWAKQFLNKYSKYLEEKYQDNAVHYGNARIYYQDKEYEKALKELAKIKNYSFIHYKPAVKILQMMIYYD